MDPEFELNCLNYWNIRPPPHVRWNCPYDLSSLNVTIANVPATSVRVGCLSSVVSHLSKMSMYWYVQEKCHLFDNVYVSAKETVLTFSVL